MLHRIISRVHPATVISTIALFAALGGGYAVAFSGSGSLQKGALKGIPASDTPIRSLTGVGSVSAECSSGNVILRITNTSGEALNITGVVGHGTGDGFSDTTPPLIVRQINLTSGGDQGWAVSDANPRNSNWNLHVSPFDGSKAPQLDLQVTISEPDSNCANASVAVLALNTQQ